MEKCICVAMADAFDTVTPCLVWFFWRCEYNVKKEVGEKVQEDVPAGFPVPAPHVLSANS